MTTTKQSPVEVIKELQKDAPCYTRVSNDGALYRCSCCFKQKVYSEVYFVIVPNKENRIVCEYCIDDDWLRQAKDMTHIKL